MIQNVINKANLDLKDIATSKSFAHLTDKMIESIKEKILKNISMLQKQQKNPKNPFLLNEIIYNRILNSTLTYFQK